MFPTKGAGSSKELTQTQKICCVSMHLCGFYGNFRGLQSSCFYKKIINNPGILVAKLCVLEALTFNRNRNSNRLYHVKFINAPFPPFILWLCVWYKKVGITHFWIIALFFWRFSTKYKPNQNFVKEDAGIFWFFEHYDISRKVVGSSVWFDLAIYLLFYGAAHVL